ncbi:MAG: class I SAM-dependent methyltransferase [Candidatus Desulforudis sp.]|nr:class I SAM-dependent methyltransferase [Desulforudis sp.]
MYASYGEGYAMFPSKIMSDIEKALYQTVVEDICQDFQAVNLLDIGCGNGKLLFYMQRRVPEAFLTGIDLSERCIRQANRYLVRYRHSVDDSKLRFMVGDIVSLPFEDDRFDKVVSTCALHHFPDLTLSFAEIHRVLKTGGKALMYDFRKEASYEDVCQTMREWSANKIRFLRPWLLRKWMREYSDSYVPENLVINLAQYSGFKFHRLTTFFLKQRPVMFKLLLVK